MTNPTRFIPKTLAKNNLQLTAHNCLCSRASILSFQNKGSFCRQNSVNIVKQRFKLKCDEIDSLSSIGMQGIGMQGIGMQGIGMQGIGMQGIGMQGIGINSIEMIMLWKLTMCFKKFNKYGAATMF